MATVEVDIVARIKEGIAKDEQWHMFFGLLGVTMADGWDEQASKDGQET